MTELLQQPVKSAYLKEEEEINYKIFLDNPFVVVVVIHKQFLTVKKLHHFY